MRSKWSKWTDIDDDDDDDEDYGRNIIMPKCFIGTHSRSPTMGLYGRPESIGFLCWCSSSSSGIRIECAWRNVYAVVQKMKITNNNKCVALHIRNTRSHTHQIHIHFIFIRRFAWNACRIDTINCPDIGGVRLMEHRTFLVECQVVMVRGGGGDMWHVECNLGLHFLSHLYMILLIAQHFLPLALPLFATWTCNICNKCSATCARGNAELLRYSDLFFRCCCCCRCMQCRPKPWCWSISSSPSQRNKRAKHSECSTKPTEGGQFFPRTIFFLFHYCSLSNGRFYCYYNILTRIFHI